MKMTKKKVFVAALAICLVAIISMGTLAWFNANDDISNTFKVATNKDDTDPTFTVEVSETDPDTNEKTVDGVTYYDVVPGDDIAKDPTVKNTGDYTQWIRVTVTLDKAQGWEEAGGTLVFTELFDGEDISYGSSADAGTDTTSTWLLVADEATVNNDKAVWYLYLNKELEAGKAATVFENVNIPTEFTQQEMAEINNEFNITVSADALQRDNTGDNAVEAFTNVGWTAGTAFVDED